MSQADGFASVSRPDARILILGSMPGQPSLAANEYYAHPHNAFWRIVAAIYGFEHDAPYEYRLAALIKNRVALWDVVGSCYREGSLDSAIRADSVRVNPFREFFRAHRRIETICFNGAKAEQIWKRHVAPGLADAVARVTFHRLPSTSPAYAAMPYGAKLEEWRGILRPET